MAKVLSSYTMLTMTVNSRSSLTVKACGALAQAAAELVHIYPGQHTVPSYKLVSKVHMGTRSLAACSAVAADVKCNTPYTCLS